MFLTKCIAALIALSLTAQFATAVPQSAPVSATTASPSMASAVTLPAGTVVPLTLVNQIKSKSTRPGDIIRAQVAFPVTNGTQLAIPAGTYVEGEVKALSMQRKHRSQPVLQIHFSRLVFANGYTVSLDAINISALQPQLVGSPEIVAALTQQGSYGSYNQLLLYRMSPSPSAYGFEQITQPPPPSLPSNGPSKGIFIGAAIGGTALLVISAIIFSHRSSARNTVLYDAGWQFQMALQSSISIPAFQVEAAAKANAN